MKNRIASWVILGLCLVSVSCTSDKLTPSAPGMGNLNMQVLAPLGLPGADPSRPDQDDPAYCAFPSATLCLFSRDTEVLPDLSNCVQKVTCGPDGRASLKGLPAGSRCRVAVVVDGKVCRIDDDVLVPSGQGSQHRKCKLEDLNPWKFTSNIRIQGGQTDFPPGSQLIFDWTNSNKTPSPMVVQWVLTAVGDPTVLATSGPQTMAPGSILNLLSVVLDLWSLPCGDYHLSSVSGGKVLDRERFHLDCPPSTPTPTPTTIPATSTATATLTVTATLTGTPVVLTATPTPTSTGCPYVSKWGSLGSSTGLMNQPIELAMDAAGDLYLADWGNNRIQVFDANGVFLRQWGSSGTGNGQFNTPIGIDVAPDGTLVVVDALNHRVQRFTSTGTYLGQWGSVGAGNGQFQQPWGAAIDASGNIYIADEWNHRVQKFSSTGTFLLKWGSYGTGQGQFNLSVGIAVDAAGDVWVSDHFNHRIQKFSPTGTFLGSWGTQGSAPGQFRQPQGLEVDSLGRIYVADDQNSRIQVFDGSMNFLTTWGTYGSGNCQFIRPTSIEVNPAGDVFVTDYGNNRIQKFHP